MAKLTIHFNEEELGVQDAEERIRKNAFFICDNILEPIRDKFEVPLIINSGYRSPEHNKQVGGVVGKSQHLYQSGDAAVDFTIAGADLKMVFDWIRLRSNLWKVDQVILEHKDYQPLLHMYVEPRVIHISTTRKENPRNQAMLGLTGGRNPYTRVDFKIADSTKELAAKII